MAHDREIALAKWNVRNIEAYNARRPLVHWLPCIMVTSSESRTKLAIIHNTGIKLVSSMRPFHTVNTLCSSMDLVAWLCNHQFLCPMQPVCPAATYPTPHVLPPHDNTPMAHSLPPTFPAPGLRGITSQQHHLLSREASLHLLCPAQHPRHPLHQWHQHHPLQLWPCSRSASIPQ